jgi:HD-like signal output (HDOD) protein
MQKIIGSTLKNVTKTAKLITLPDVYLRLKSILDEPDFAMAEITLIISQDPAITLRLLRMVNSSLYGFATKIETVSHAITLLGTQQVHDIVLATSVAQTFKGISTEIIDMPRFWWHSVYCAVASRKLAGLCGRCDRERLFVAGLLHDIGHLVMYQVIPGLSQQAILEAKDTSEPLYRIERKLIGYDYAEINAQLMQQWSMPESLREPVMFHIEPEKAVEYPLETALVHLGSLMKKAKSGEGIFNEGALTVEPSVWILTGITMDDCLSLNDQIYKEVQEVMTFIFS